MFNPHWYLKAKRQWLFVAVVLMVAGIRLSPHPTLASLAPSSTAILAADGSLLRLSLAQDDQYRLWVPLAQIAPHMVEAVQLQEDQWFYWHPGFNPISLIRGAIETYHGGNHQGGSTLTMQLARLIDGLNTRSPAGKLKQIALAVWLELRYSKHDLLEAYLNLAPYGYNIQGVGAASLIYFGKTANQLTLPEIMTLAVIPQKPNQRGAHNDDLQQARLRLFKRWQSQHPTHLSDARLMQLPLPLRTIKQLPFKAPHFSELLMQAEVDEQSHQIKSTLQPKLQNLIERQMHQYIEQQRTRGIRNASALLVDTRNQAVVAMVGSANFADATISGQVNGTLAKRSPGSTLKPFIYGMAFDQGIIHPQSILRDAPTAFGPFQPENFDGRFTGPISAHDALIRSRNIPAVDVASKLHNPSFYAFLKNAGISKLMTEAHYGLAIVLGGGEVTMEELATLYTMLANQGALQTLRYQTSQAPSPIIQLMSPEASFMVWDILHDNPRPDGIPTALQSRWNVAWKTGTSWGFRDAWTAGIIGPYVLVVWVGNFDGSANPAFIGIEAAAPLFFRIADALPMIAPNTPDLAHLPPRNLKKVRICAASGDLPNQWCPTLSDTWFIPGKSPIKVSTLHRPVMIDNQSGWEACAPYDPNRTHQEVFEFWDSSMMRLFREAGMPRRAPPVSHCGEQTQMHDSADSPKISSPLIGVSYQVRLSRAHETIALQATSAADAHTLYWFSDQSYLGNTPSKDNGLAWRPAQSGWHHLTVVDDQSRADTRDVQIELIP